MARATARKQIALIVNPYATPSRAALRNLVVAALRSRYEVARDRHKEPGHATQLCARGRRGGRRRGDHARRRRDRQRGGQRARRQRRAAVLPARRRAERLRKMLGIPGDIVDATQHLLRIADAWRPRRVDLGRVEGRCSLSRPASASTRASSSASTRTPRSKARWRERYYAVSAARVFLRRYVVRPPRIRVETDTALGVALGDLGERPGRAVGLVLALTGGSGERVDDAEEQVAARCSRGGRGT